MSESKLTYTPPPKIAVFHPQLDSSGGAEAVCAHLLGTLKDDCSIDLYTMSGTDFAIWNKTFGTNISNDEVQVHKIFNIFDITSRYANLFFRYIPSIVSTEYDKLISTKRMSFFGRKKGLQYVHFPYLADKKVIKKYHPYAFEDRYGNFTKRVRSLPHDLLSPSNSMICRNDTVVNSKWTSRIVQQWFGKHKVPAYRGTQERKLFYMLALSHLISEPWRCSKFSEKCVRSPWWT
jgi:hypothetical protein